LKKTSDGIERMPYFCAVAGLWSTSSLTILALPSYSAASSSTVGAIVRQGPHQTAQKSTRTGWSLSRTSVWKLASVPVTRVDRGVGGEI